MSRTPTCLECDEPCVQSGRLTWYCPDCETCTECGCPAVDGFEHNLGCSIPAEWEESP